MELIDQPIYCVYRHIRPDRNEVFYVGIGDKYRPYEKGSRNSYWHNIVKLNPEYEVEVLFENITWLECLKKEIELIKLYGRKDLGLGTLCNLTDGGEGNLGWKPSKETKEKQSAIKKGKITSAETRAKLSKIGKEKTLTEEHKKKIGLANSISHKGKIISVEVRANMSKAQIGRKHSTDTLVKMRGRKHTDEEKEKIAKAQLKKVKVINIITNEAKTYNSILETATSVGIHRSEISNYVKNRKIYKKTFSFDYPDKNSTKT